MATLDFSTGDTIGFDFSVARVPAWTVVSSFSEGISTALWSDSNNIYNIYI